jgi:hypothetical protein
LVLFCVVGDLPVAWVAAATSPRLSGARVSGTSVRRSNYELQRPSMTGPVVLRGSLDIQSSRWESLAAPSCNAFRYGLRFSSILSVGAEIPSANGDTPLSMGTAMQLRPG